MLRLKAKGQYKEKCHNCGKTFKPGNIILSKMTRSYSHHSGRKWYCKKCAKKLKLL
jgi:predicted SprT family Zn-dependent metalloprotease